MTEQEITLTLSRKDAEFLLLFSKHIIDVSNHKISENQTDAPLLQVHKGNLTAWILFKYALKNALATNIEKTWEMWTLSEEDIINAANNYNIELDEFIDLDDIADRFKTEMNEHFLTDWEQPLAGCIRDSITEQGDIKEPGVFSETCQFCKKTFQCSHPNTAYSIRAAHEDNCLENPKNKRPEDRFKKTTCVNCNNFKLIFGLPNGICLKGHGYTDKTAQGLPVPKKGTGYVMYFDPTCTEDFEEIKEIDKEDRFKKPVKEKVCACETDGKSLCGDKQSMNTLFHFKVTCKDCNDILRKRSQPNDTK